MYFLKFLIIATSLIYTKGIDIKLKYCRFQCRNSCETPKEEDKSDGTAESPGAYYWRDFYGVIPPDAYPLGTSTQYPQTYIGMVFDPSNNGTFATTIFDGLSYVYTALNGNATKIDKHIQILCTKSPGRMAWISLTEENIRTVLESYGLVIAAFHIVSQKSKPTIHFIVKSDNCHVTYAGNVNSLNAKLEYAMIDGSYGTSEKYLWLSYKKQDNDSSEDSGSKQPSPSKSFFSHTYEYQIRPNSIIPQFYKKLTVGSCSLTCTNKKNGNIKKFEKDEKLSSSLAYYWKPNSVYDEKEALLIGKKYGKPSYIAQGYAIANQWDVGEGTKTSVAIRLANFNHVEYTYIQTLSSINPEKFRWVNTTAVTFSKLDRNILIPGGALDNGTETFVCRYVLRGDHFPGSARVFSDGTYCFAFFGAEPNYEVLTVNQTKI